MQSTVLLCFAAFVACACARVYVPLGYAAEEYPEFYHPSKIVRHPRDLSGMDGSSYGPGGFYNYLQRRGYPISFVEADSGLWLSNFEQYQNEQIAEFGKRLHARLQAIANIGKTEGTH